MKTQNPLLSIFCALILLLSAICAHAQQTDFSGHWKLDKNKTDFGQAPEYVLTKAMTVTKNADGFTIERTNLTTKLDEKKYTEQLRLDGKSTQTQTITGNTETDSLSNKAGALIISMDIQSPEKAALLNVVETWTLQDDGTLLVDKQVKQSNGAVYEIKGYYTKQQ